ncbi:uncharacterized protein LOC115745917 [Rhodamnia argentea]|uniref:Uncharacterized protein LOC115745917 n=1 Tax=Rhodamnia argentea TaxID=178133 RepID=A0A8B8PRJ2_9MYRT|nr:uncharacterized protein LOC115745917 [Rhodamnia argentea]
MKLLSSSPSFSSSTICTSSDAYLCSPKGSTSGGCITGVLRRILCSRSLPTHPFECDKDRDQFKPKGKNEPNTTPGIVARLMGLESLPNSSSTHTHKSPNSISRSRSLNYLDFKEDECDDDETKWQHLRVSSTLSFRETPTYLEIENEEFLVLNFGNGSEKEGRKRRSSKSKTQCGKPKGESERGGATESSSSDSVLANDDLGTPETLRSQVTKVCQSVRSLEAACGSEEDSSPVSVLDFGEFISDPQVSTSDDSRSERPSSRKKLAPELENNEHSSPRSDSDLLDDQPKQSEGKRHGSRKRRQSYSEMWSQICKISEEETIELDWLDPRMVRREDIEGIGQELELQIFCELLDELLDNTSSTPE